MAMYRKKPCWGGGNRKEVWKSRLLPTFSAGRLELLFKYGNQTILLFIPRSISRNNKDVSAQREGEVKYSRVNIQIESRRCWQRKRDSVGEEKSKSNATEEKPVRVSAKPQGHRGREISWTTVDRSKTQGRQKWELAIILDKQIPQVTSLSPKQYSFNSGRIYLFMF